ncbi:MAG: acetamidase/formamidase family protein [bacterium]|nr:acetamidase/formamidase family protein [bacterium]
MNKIYVSGDKDKLHYRFSAANTPRAYANPGDQIIFSCIDAYCNQIIDETTLFSEVNRELGNPVTGPVYINGALPGDILKINILSIEGADSAVMTARPNAGFFGELIPAYASKLIPLQANKAYFNDNIVIDMKPMIGVLGLACEGSTLSTIPGEHGGNMDCKDLTAGTSVYLPVFVAGGLLSMGDLHGVQGDGETVICALEMNGTVTVTVEVLKNRSDIITPLIVTAKNYLTLYSDSTIDLAAKGAAFKMHKFLLTHTKMTIQEIAMLISLLGNLRICQVVNPLMTCCLEFPRNLINEEIVL